jgi:GDP-L-fucose synthase
VRVRHGKIKDIVEFKGELIFNTSKPDGTMVKLTNLDKLHNLGWHHKIELNDGIKTVFNQYKTQALNNI